MTRYEITGPFKKRLRKKDARQQGAILECIHRLAEDPRSPGLQTHRVQGQPGVYEAYVTRGDRLTFHYEGDLIVFRNHCNHDMLDRSP